MAAEAQQFIAWREAVIAALTARVQADDRLRALWLQGSLADGSSDALSDIDAYLAVEDEALPAVFAEAEQFVASFAEIWTSAITPQLRAFHAVVAASDGPSKLDLFFEPVSTLGAKERPAVRVLLDKDGAAASLKGGWQPKVAEALVRFDIMFRATRQGALWPVRHLLRGDLTTFATAELRLIDENLAAVMAVRVDPRYLFLNPLSMPRRLPREMRAELDTLANDLFAALAARDLLGLRDVHVRASDALMREGRAAYAALGRPYPGTEAGDAALRRFYLDHWPAQLGG
jgi:hypothetical protein